MNVRAWWFIAIVASLLMACDQLGDLAGLHQGDFYECEPNNTLVVCKVGTGPPADMACQSVGSGTTTIEPKAC